jgi:anti-repressor protein
VSALIPERLDTVDARELHASLGLTKDFSTWFKATVERLALVEGFDFVSCSPSKGSESHGGQNRIDYKLSQHAAKRIQASAKGDVGEAAREGLVKLHDHVEAILAPSEDEIILRAQQILQSRVKALTEQVAELQSRAEIADRLTRAEGEMSLSDAARRLGFGPRTFIAKLACEGILHGHVRYRRPRADALKAGYFVVRSVEIGEWPDGSPRFEGQTMVTYAGLSWLSGRYERKGLLPVRSEARP